MKAIVPYIVICILLFGLGEFLQTHALYTLDEDDEKKKHLSGVSRESLFKTEELAIIKQERLDSRVKDVFYAVEHAGKKIALTFDDGPNLEYTPKILKILKKEKVRATFFVIGSSADLHPHLITAIKESDHEIGNHTWDHKSLTNMSYEEIERQVHMTEDTIFSITGERPNLVRPPYGMSNPYVENVIKSLDQDVIYWSVDTEDWKGISTEDIVKNGKLNTGNIILMHDSGGKNGDLSNTLEALPKIIKYYEEKGYTFVTVSELIRNEVRKQ